MSRSNDKSYEPPAAMPSYLHRYVTLRQLQVFEAIVRLGGFTRAADELFLAQPTVSMQIKKLAESVGTPLFEHMGRNVRPTEAGQELYQSCRRIFEILANLEMKVADLQGIRTGRLRLCVVSTAKYFAPEMLGEFRAEYPGIEVALKVSNRERVLERINAYEDDLYVMGQTPTTNFNAEVHPLAPNPLVIVAPKEHPLVGEKNIPLSRIAEEPIILREPGSGTRDATLRLFEQHGLTPKVSMELGSNEAIKHAIVGGLGLSVLSLHTMTLEGSQGPVALLDVEGFPIIRRWHIVYPKGKELSPVAKAFLEFALEREPLICSRLFSEWPQLEGLIPDTVSPSVDIAAE